MKKSFLAVSIIGLLLTIPLMAKAIFHQSERYYISNDLCQLQTVTELASNYGNYQLEQDFDAPAIRVFGDSHLLQKISQHYDRLYAAHTQSAKPCHLANARYHVKNVNPRLAKRIPNDVDYVSYAPNADKAMYCYYHLSSGDTKSGSQCFFLQIENNYGIEWLIRDDISDLENANLTWAKDNYQSVKNQTTFNNVYTYVSDWNNNPSLMYGVTLATNFNGNRWLAGGIY